MRAPTVHPTPVGGVVVSHPKRRERVLDGAQTFVQRSRGEKTLVCHPPDERHQQQTLLSQFGNELWDEFLSIAQRAPESPSLIPGPA